MSSFSCSKQKLMLNQLWWCHTRKLYIKSRRHGYYSRWCNSIPSMLSSLMHIFAAILVVRIWYLYRHSRIARILAVACFVTCVTAECVALGVSFKDLHSEIILLPGVRILELGCIAPPSSKLWRMFFSAFVLHTVLYIFTAYRGIRNRSIVAEAAPLIKRLLREYAIVQFLKLAIPDS